MNTKKRSAIVAIIGLVLAVAGVVAVKYFGLDGVTVPYLGIGLGCGLLGQGTGELITAMIEKGDPKAKRRREIEENDERNIALRDKAQAKAYRITKMVFGSVIIALALMKVTVKFVLLLIAAYLYICGCSVYYSAKYRKEM